MLWDVFPDGRRLGGAPLNFAYHAGRLGGSGAIASRVGSDDLGREALERAAEMGLAVDHVQADPSLPTGTVTVELDEAGVPDYTIHEHVAWDALEFTPALAELAAGADCVAFGTLAQREKRSRRTIGRFLDAAAGARRIFDVNLRQSFYSREVIERSLELATVVKLSGGEIEVLCDLLEMREVEQVERLRELISRFSLELAALTLGSGGCVLATEISAARAPSPEVEVVDTVGSGDAFAAALAVGMAEEMPLEDLARFSNLAGAYVAARAGATPPMSRDAVEAFGRSAG
jgi:fructokinase